MSLVTYLGWGDICSHLCRNRIVQQIISEWLFTKVGLGVSIVGCLVWLNWCVKSHANYRQNLLATVKVKEYWSQQAFCSFIQFVFTLSVELVCLASTTTDSFIVIRVSSFGLLLWSENQQLSRNPFGFWHHTGPDEIDHLS